MLRQPFIQECVVAIEEFQHAAIFAHNMAEIHLGLLPHGLPQRTVQLDRRTAEPAAALLDQTVAFALFFGRESGFGLEFLKPPPGLLQILFFAILSAQHRARIDVDAFDVAHLEPLPGEILDQLLRTTVRQHAFDLRGHVRPQLAAFGETKQFVVRHGGPEEIREPRRQCILINQRMGFDGPAGFAVLHAKQKPG